MNESTTLDFPNIHFASQSEIRSFNLEQGIIPLKVEEIPSMTVVTWRDTFFGVQHNPINNGQSENGGTFYIIKYNKVLTFSQFTSFVKEHSKEEFLLIDDYSSNSTDVRVFVEVKPNILKLYFFSLYGGNGHFVQIATLQNQEGTCKWGEIQNLSKGKITITLSRNSTDESYNFNFPTQSTATYRTPSLVDTFLIFNSSRNQGKVGIGNIMVNYLYLPGLTRVKCELAYNRSIEYRLTTGDEATQSLTERYGIEKPSNDQYWYSTQIRVHANDCFPQADLDEVSFNRISEKIKDYLNDPDAKAITVRGERYNQNSTAYVKDIVAISQPIPGHRRPTYHIIRGIKHGGNIDVVEIARGELNIQQMIPETGYYLHKSGKYCRVTHLIFSNIRDIITHAEIDPITLNSWIDNKALHPTLIKAAQEAMNDNKMALSDIQIFNTVKFGSLFIEQLIKTKYFTLATSLAKYINNNGER